MSAWLALCLVVGCTEADVADGDIPLHALKDIEAGFQLNVLASRTPVTRSILFSSEGTVETDSLIAGDKGGINTRAAQSLDEEQESKIAGLWVGQYDASTETLLFNKYFSTFTGNTVNIKLKQSSDGAESHVWFIANVGDLGKIDTEKNLKEHVLSYASTVTGLPENSNLCGMTGLWKGVVKEGGLKNIEVELTRLLAKIEFTYSMKRNNLIFTPASVTLKFVPQKFQIDAPESQLSDMTYTSYDGIVNEEGTTVYWYLPENMAGTVSSEYIVDSEKKKTGKGVSNATFIELTGMAVQGEVTYENVIFCFYPGNDKNNYDIVRNSYYKMDVTLAGIDISDERITVGTIPPIVVTGENMPAKEGGTKEVQITARPGQPWSFYLEDWLSAMIDGKDVTDVNVSHQGPAKVSFTAKTANPKAKERSMHFSVNVNGTDQDITITQDGSTLTKGDDISLGAAAGLEGSSTCKVTKGLQWQATISEEGWWNWSENFPVISAEDDSDVSDLLLKIKSVNPNPQAQERTGKITVTAGASMNDPTYSDLKKDILVKQAGSTVEGSTVEVGAEAATGQSSSFTATSGLSWAAKITNDDWITLAGVTSGDQTTGSAQTISFDVKVNPNASQRSGTITVRAGEEDGGPTGAITVNQKASVFTVSESVIVLPYTASSGSVMVNGTSGLLWTVQPSETTNGITPEITSSTTDGADQTLTFNATENKEGARSTTFTVAVTGGNHSKAVEVKQKPGITNMVTVDAAIVAAYKSAFGTTYPPFNYEGEDRHGISSSCELTEDYSIEVEKTQRAGFYNYTQAKNQCESGDWRLPTMIELYAMWNKCKGINNDATDDEDASTILGGDKFTTSEWFWSGSVYDAVSHCELNMGRGEVTFCNIVYGHCIRCVRDL